MVKTLNKNKKIMAKVNSISHLPQEDSKPCFGIFFYKCALSIVVIVLILTLILRRYGQGKLPPTISLYYETHCPYSARLIVNQFGPVNEKLGSAVNLDFVPFGLVNVTTDRQTMESVFRCQHGQEECYGARVQACVIRLTRQYVSTRYIVCMEERIRDLLDNTYMIQRDSTRAIAVWCAQRQQQQELNWTQINECTNGPLGKQLITENWKRTTALQLAAVPHVHINGVHNKTIAAGARDNLLQHLCAHYLDGQNVPACMSASTWTGLNRDRNNEMDGLSCSN